MKKIKENYHVQAFININVSYLNSLFIYFSHFDCEKFMFS